MLLPLRDTIAPKRMPVATLALSAAVAGLHLAGVAGGWDLVRLAADALLLWVLAPTLEDTLGRTGLVVLALLGGAVVVAVEIVAGGAGGSIALAASGAVAAVAGGYLGLSPRGRVLAASFVPFFFTMVELPAAVIAAAWAGQLLALEGAGAGLAGCAAALAGAAVAVRLLARPRPYVPAPYRVA